MAGLEDGGREALLAERGASAPLVSPAHAVDGQCRGVALRLRTPLRQCANARRPGRAEPAVQRSTRTVPTTRLRTSRFGEPTWARSTGRAPASPGATPRWSVSCQWPSSSLAGGRAVTRTCRAAVIRRPRSTNASSCQPSSVFGRAASPRSTGRAPSPPGRCPKTATPRRRTRCPCPPSRRSCRRRWLQRAPGRFARRSYR